MFNLCKCFKPKTRWSQLTQNFISSGGLILLKTLMLLKIYTLYVTVHIDVCMLRVKNYKKKYIKYIWGRGYLFVGVYPCGTSSTIAHHLNACGQHTHEAS